MQLYENTNFAEVSKNLA